MKNGVLQKDNFKIVYVAPMKALAAEMTATFGKRLAALGELLCLGSPCRWHLEQFKPKYIRKEFQFD